MKEKFKTNKVKISLYVKVLDVLRAKLKLSESKGEAEDLLSLQQIYFEEAQNAVEHLLKQDKLDQIACNKAKAKLYGLAKLLTFCPEDQDKKAHMVFESAAYPESIFFRKKLQIYYSLWAEERGFELESAEEDNQLLVKGDFAYSWLKLEAAKHRARVASLGTKGKQVHCFCRLYITPFSFLKEEHLKENFFLRTYSLEEGYIKDHRSEERLEKSLDQLTGKDMDFLINSVQFKKLGV